MLIHTESFGKELPFSPNEMKLHFHSLNIQERLVKFGTCSEKFHLKVFPYIIQCFVFGRYNHVTGVKNSYNITMSKPNPIYYIFSE